MNRILFEPRELQSDGTVTLFGTRAEHIRAVLGAEPGRVLRVGLVDGLAGMGRVLACDQETARLAVTLEEMTPAPWIDLLLAVPRPKALKRLWAQLAALGVGRIVLLGAARVEREYFATHWLQERYYRPLLMEGLSQAGTTALPQVTFERRFRPYVEDRLDTDFPDSARLLAHPGAVARPTGLAAGARILLAIGPEGGWTEFELRMLEARGFSRFSLGTRTLRTDTACVALISVLAAAFVWGDGEPLTMVARSTAGGEA